MLIGLLITRDDHDVFDEWCGSQLGFYDAVVCLDGSESDTTRQMIEPYRDRILYVHERDRQIPHKTDHGLRRVVHHEICSQFGPGHWIMCCHVDEFCYHDPRKIVQLADAQHYDQVSWYSPHFYPHPSELRCWDVLQQLPVVDRHRFYHWGHLGSGLPWIEDRLYRDGRGVDWDSSTHGSVRPHGLRNPAPFHPIFQHYKVVARDIDWCEASNGRTHYRHHWPGLQHRTGLPYTVQHFEDLFVDRLLNYSVCSYLKDRFDQPWNMGDEFRPSNSADLGQRAEQGIAPKYD